jgi:hypothetical protein
MAQKGLVRGMLDWAMGHCRQAAVIPRQGRKGQPSYRSKEEKQVLSPPHGYPTSFYTRIKPD